MERERNWLDTTSSEPTAGFSRIRSRMRPDSGGFMNPLYPIGLAGRSGSGANALESIAERKFQRISGTSTLNTMQTEGSTRRSSTSCERGLSYVATLILFGLGLVLAFGRLGSSFLLILGILILMIFRKNGALLARQFQMWSYLW